MSQIYTVKPLKDALKIAAANDDIEIEACGHVRIFGISTECWPADAKVNTDKPTYYIKIDSYSIPVRYCNVENKEAPQFILNLYKAMSDNCNDVECKDCPLSHLPDLCGNVVVAMRRQWGFEE